MKNLHLFLTPFTHESRALKQSKSLIDSGLFDEVLFAVSWTDHLPERETIDSHRSIWRVKLSIPEKRVIYRLRYYEWIARILVNPASDDVEVVQCHSLLSLPVGLLFKLFKRSKVIYDAHELETESNGLKGKRKLLYKIIERLFIPFVDAVMVVSDPIADWYEKHYPIPRPYVVRNIPSMKQNSTVSRSDICLKNIFNIPENETLFIYVGGLFRGRGIELLLNAFAQADRTKHIVFMGYGEFEEKIQDYQRQFSNIHFHPAVSPDLVLSYTQTADVGISLIENICLSYYYCLPNKVFEYITSGLPIIVSDFPEMGKLIDNHDCGWKVPVEDTSFLHLINSITLEMILEKRKNIQVASQHFGWHLEEKTLLEAYQSVL